MSRLRPAQKIIVLNAVGILFVMSLLFFILEIQFLSFFFKLLGLMLVFAVLYPVIFKHSEQSHTWLLLSFACLLCMICDTCLYVGKYILENDQKFLYISYVIPSFFIFSGIFIHFLNRFNKDVDEKLMVANDFISIILMLCIFFIIMFDGYDYSNFFLNKFNVAALFGILFSFGILFCVLGVVFASSTLVIHVSFFYVMLACVITCISSIFYYYNILNNIYTEDILSLFAYMFSFFLLLFGTYSFTESNKIIKAKHINFSIISKWLPVLCVIPFMFKSTSSPKITFYIMLVLFIHVLISYHIKNKNYTEKLQKKEQNLMQELEKNVAKDTNKIILANLKLKEMVEKDRLTGLYSRAILNQKIDNMISEQEDGEFIVIYYINLSKFKMINLSYGHIVGDRILKIIAKRINLLCEHKNIASRLGADEFIMVANFKSIANKEHIEFANKIISSIQENIKIEPYNFVIKPMVGIDISEFESGKDSNVLIKNADKVMYFLKNSQNLNIATFNQEIEDIVNENSYNCLLLNKADINKDFCVYYQPVLDLNTGEIVSVEALLRWNSKELGMIEASEFMHIAQKTDFMDKIYNFVLTSVGKNIAYFKEAGLNYPKISINISPRQSMEPYFMYKIKSVMKEYEIPAGSLILEINELIWQNNLKMVNEIFDFIKRNGIRVCIDDFGIEHSSINYLKKYDIRSIKISNKLTGDINTNAKNALVVKTIINLSKTIKIKSIAKGIENIENLELLRQFGCNLVQGNIVKEAMALDDFKNFLLEKQDKKI